MKKTIPVILFSVVVLILMILSFMEAIDEQVGMCITIFLVILFDIWVAYIAHKSEVSIVTIVMSVFAIVGVILLGLNLYALLNVEEESGFNYQVTVKENTSPKTKLFTYDEVDYYTYNLESVSVEYGSKSKYTLEEAFINDKLNLDDILSLAIPNSDTVGYKIYYDEGQEDYNDDKYAIVVCDNTDVIFTKYDYRYNEKICNTSDAD